MSYPTFILGQNNWAVSSSSILGYEYGSLSGQFSPVFLTSSRASTATYVNAAGLIVTASNNISRIDYSTGTGSLLLEPQRTNLLTYSDEFSDASWTNQQSSITANVTTSPDGTANADKLIENTANASHTVFKSITLNTSTSYNFSIYLKSAERFRVRIRFTSFSGANDASVNLNLGTTTAGTLTNVGNGWYRFDWTVNSSTGASSPLVAITLQDSSGNSTYTGDGSSGAFIWGAQLEVGAYATTYIPTGAATATRLADTFNRANMVTNGYIGPSGSTWYVELRNNVAYTRDGLSTGLFIDSNTNSFTNGINIRNVGGGSTRLVITKWIGGVGASLFTTTTDNIKIAIKWNGTSADVFVNGVKQVSATSFTPTNMEFLAASNTQVPTFIQAMALYDYPLPDSELITLTT